MKTFKTTGVIANYHNNYFEKRKEMRKKANKNYCIWPTESPDLEVCDNEKNNNANEVLFKSFFKNNLYYKEE
jgi:hypothetical protein